MDFEDVQDALLERLKVGGEGLGFDVFETALPLGYKAREENGRIVPYALVSFGGKSPVAMSAQGIVGTRKDLRWTSVAVECIGASQSDARKLAKIIRDLLDGYQPDDTWGELIERLSGDYTVQQPDADIWAPRYATGIVFNTNTNA